MHDPMTVAQRLVERVQLYADQVDLVCIYGSRARGDARPDSDLDIYYVPAEGCSPPVGKTFLYEGLLYDFWGIGWELLEGFATGKVREFAFAPALVAGNQVIWRRDQAAVDRLDALKAEIARLESPAARREMVGRALERFATVSARLVTVRHATESGVLADVRWASWGVIDAVWECLALANQVRYDKGMAKSLGQVERFARRPKSLGERIERLTMGDPADALAVAQALADDTRALLVAMASELPATCTVAQAMDQAYPELKDALGKVLAACRAGDGLAARLLAGNVQFELTMILGESEQGVFNPDMNTLSEMGAPYRAAGFPDLLAAAEEGLEPLAAAVDALDARLRALLGEHGVALGEVTALEAL